MSAVESTFFTTVPSATKATIIKAIGPTFPTAFQAANKAAYSAADVTTNNTANNTTN